MLLVDYGLNQLLDYQSDPKEHSASLVRDLVSDNAKLPRL